VSGAARVSAPERVFGDKLDLNISGAGNVTLSELAYRDISTNASGAAQIVLSGTTTTQTVQGSGASSINASQLETSENAEINLSGASNARINTHLASGRISLSSNLTLNPDARDHVRRASVEQAQRAQAQAERAQAHLQRDIERAQRDIERAHRQVATAQQRGNVVIVNRQALGNIDSLVFDSQSVVVDVDTNTRIITIGNRTVTTTTTQQTSGNRRQPMIIWNPKYGIFDFGWAGFGQSFFRHDLPDGYENMQLALNNSFAINMNLFRYGVRLGGRNSSFGVGTGAGMGWDVYRFLDASMVPVTSRMGNSFAVNPHLETDNADWNFRRSALRTTWLRVPLYLQYSQPQPRRSFYATAGVVGNVRMGARSRQIYDFNGKKDDKTKDHFYLNGFRADAELRVGFRQISMFATYGLTNMFLKDKGPEVSTFSFGVSFWPG
jgi:hypothetical protein